MNVVIIGCGNIGFETAKLLSESHSVLLINHRCPEYLKDFLQQNNNVSFALADALDLPSVESILDKSNGGFDRIDALVSTVGAFCPTSAVDDFDRFKRNFFLNFFGNLVPIKAVLKHMIPGRSGKIVVLSSTSAVFSYPGLTAYTPAKWALTSFCQALRIEVKPYGISVDVVFPKSIKNKRSRTFLYKNGIGPEQVAAKITEILDTNANADHFVPRRYALMSPLERIFPSILDRRAGLRRERKRRFCSRQVKSVLITNASSRIGKELSLIYAKSAERLYLLGQNEAALSETKKGIAQSSDCAVDIVSLDIGNCEAVSHLVSRIESVDLVINNVGFSVAGSIRGIPIAHYERSLATNFFGPVQLTAGLLQKEMIPAKIINIISISSVAGRLECSCYSVSHAALRAFTRSLRRTFGNEIQVIEVVPATSHRSLRRYAVRIESKGNIEHRCDCGQSSRAPPTRNWAAMTVARQICEAEIKGKEVALIPFTGSQHMYID